MCLKGVRLCIILFSLYLPSSAQIAIGVESGVSNNYLSADISDQILTTLYSDMGLKAGIPFQIKIFPWLFAEIEPEILQKSYLVNRAGQFEGVYKKQTNTYLQLPLTAGGTYGERLKIFANAGIYTGYWLSG